MVMGPCWRLQGDGKFLLPPSSHTPLPETTEILLGHTSAALNSLLAYRALLPSPWGHPQSVVPFLAYISDCDEAYLPFPWGSCPHLILGGSLDANASLGHSGVPKSVL